MTRHGTDGMAWHGTEWKGMSVLFGPSANNNDVATTVTVANLFAFWEMTRWLWSRQPTSARTDTATTRRWAVICWVPEKAKPPWECCLS